MYRNDYIILFIILLELERKLLKRILLVIFAVIFVLSACGNKNVTVDSGKEGSETVVNEAEEKIILKSYEDLVAAYNNRDANAALEIYGSFYEKRRVC